MGFVVLSRAVGQAQTVIHKLLLSLHVGTILKDTSSFHRTESTAFEKLGPLSDNLRMRH